MTARLHDCKTFLLGQEACPESEATREALTEQLINKYNALTYNIIKAFIIISTETILKQIMEKEYQNKFFVLTE
jgi:hypothetical protein